MRKLLLMVLIVCFAFVMISCSNQVENNVTPVEEETSVVEETPVVEEKPVLNIATLKGPTGMGMVQLMENDALEVSAIDYTFDIVGAPDQLVGKVVQGQVDIAAVPSNLAAVLNVKTEGKVQLLGVNTLGVLYVLQNGDEVSSLDDLKGQKIVASGQGATPEYVINYLLDQKGLSDDITVEYAAEHAEASAMIASGKADYALLPQPFVTSTLLANQELSIAVDLTKAWEEVTEGAVLPMGAVIVNKAFAEENPDVVAKFMEEYKASVDFVNAQPQEAGLLIEKHGILPKAALATKAIPNCNITLLTAQESKDDLMKFYEILKASNPKSIGGQLPEDAFFYEAN